jgi:hypothetical protein
MSRQTITLSRGTCTVRASCEDTRLGESSVDVKRTLRIAGGCCDPATKFRRELPREARLEQRPLSIGS